jgi:hypothetical protein
VKDLLAFPASQPYFLAGYCSGAPVALEMARRLQEQGRTVGLLVIMDGYAPGYPLPKPGTGRLAISFFSTLDRLRRLAAFVAYVGAANRGRRAAILKGRLAGEAGALMSLFKPYPRRSGESTPSLGLGYWPGSEYKPAPYTGTVLLLRPSREPLGFRPEPLLGWAELISEGLRVVTMRGYFRTLIYPPWVRRLSSVLDSRLKKAQES